MDRVSCIIPTHNRADILPGAIESVRNQTHENLEIIVVDDASTDETEAVLSQYEEDDRFTALRTDHQSPQAARNEGIEAATGEYIAFLDDDDRWHPEKIETQLKYADEYSVVSCITRIILPSGEKTQSHDFSGVKTYHIDDIFRDTSYFYPSGTLARAEYIDEIDGFDEDVTAWDFYLKLVAEFGPAIVVGRPLVDFNRKDIERVSKNSDHYKTNLDVYERHKYLASRAAQRERYGNMHYSFFRHDDGLTTRLASLARAIYYNPTILKRIGKQTTGRLLERANMKEPVKQVVYSDG